MFSLRSGSVRIALWITVNPSSENRQKQIKERTEEDENASGIRVLARQPGSPAGDYGRAFGVSGAKAASHYFGSDASA
jgi:hypothetical protein